MYALSFIFLVPVLEIMLVKSHEYIKAKKFERKGNIKSFKRMKTK